MNTKRRAAPLLAFILSVITLSGCAAPAPTSQGTHPFIGCWQSDDGLSREVWAGDPSGWLFGYALNRTPENTVSFFEHMRIETADEKSVLVVVGAKGDIVRFPRETTQEKETYRFVNADHDYPQVITYTPSAGRLDAVISLLDGSEAFPFKKRACDKAMP